MIYKLSSTQQRRCLLLEQQTEYMGRGVEGVQAGPPGYAQFILKRHRPLPSANKDYVLYAQIMRCQK